MSDPASATVERPRRRPWQFGVRALLLLITAVAVYLGYESWQIAGQRRLAARLTNLGASVTYGESAPWSLIAALAPDSAREMAGVDFRGVQRFSTDDVRLVAQLDQLSFNVDQLLMLRRDKLLEGRRVRVRGYLLRGYAVLPWDRNSVLLQDEFFSIEEVHSEADFDGGVAIEFAAGTTLDHLTVELVTIEGVLDYNYQYRLGEVLVHLPVLRNAVVK
jgi:hypothetical protein